MDLCLRRTLGTSFSHQEDGSPTFKAHGWQSQAEAPHQGLKSNSPKWMGLPLKCPSLSSCSARQTGWGERVWLPGSPGAMGSGGPSRTLFKGALQGTQHVCLLPLGGGLFPPGPKAPQQAVSSSLLGNQLSFRKAARLAQAHLHPLPSSLCSVRTVYT